MIIVDEEHETSYKQYDPAPRYHARDTAIYLAHQHQAKVLLGSATPSVESYYNAKAGKYGLIEIKLGGGSLINEGAKTLTALASKIDTGAMKTPSFMMILTATGNYAYRREDGIIVVPLGCLKD